MYKGSSENGSPPFWLVFIGNLKRHIQRSFTMDELILRADEPLTKCPESMTPRSRKICLVAQAVKHPNQTQTTKDFARPNSKLPSSGIPVAPKTSNQLLRLLDSQDNKNRRTHVALVKHSDQIWLCGGISDWVSLSCEKTKTKTRATRGSGLREADRRPPAPHRRVRDERWCS